MGAEEATGNSRDFTISYSLKEPRKTCTSPSQDTSNAKHRQFGPYWYYSLSNFNGFLIRSITDGASNFFCLSGAKHQRHLPFFQVSINSFNKLKNFSDLKKIKFNWKYEWRDCGKIEILEQQPQRRRLLLIQYAERGSKNRICTIQLSRKLLH